jgi:hypothetical protein
MNWWEDAIGACRVAFLFVDFPEGFPEISGEGI